MEENLETMDGVLDVETIFDLTDCNVGQKVSRPETPKGTFEVYVGTRPNETAVTLRQEGDASLIVNIISLSDCSSVKSCISGKLVSTDDSYQFALTEYNRGATA